jgi:hypothetical protein
MGRIFCRIMMTLCCTILLAAAVQARTLKEVYLRDGGIINCQKVWQENGKVMVLVNRDTLLDLSKSEVDLKKTFARKPAQAVKKTKSSKKAASKPAAAVQQGVPEPLAEEAVAPAAKQKPATPAEKQPVTAGVKATPQAAKQKSAESVKPQPPAAKQPPATAVKAPAPSAVKSPQAEKPAVQQSATSAKNPVPGAAATPVQPRPNLPLAKPATPTAPEKPLLTGNMTNIALAGLLVLLVVCYVVYKKKQKS